MSLKSQFQTRQHHTILKWFCLYSEPQTNFTFSPWSSNGLLAILTYRLELEPVLRIRIHIFWGLLDPDPDPLVRGMDPDPFIIKQK
jgi:hypothetical protein